MVLDASAAVRALEEDGPARQRLAADSFHAPHLIDAEVTHALRTLARLGELTPAVAANALWVWQHYALQRHGSVEHLDRAWSLRNNLSAYDALYVALAEDLGCRLVTADGRLARASGPRCEIEFLPS